jgi:general secretion pathway protein D
MIRRLVLIGPTLASLTACMSDPAKPPLEPLPIVQGIPQTATPRVNGLADTPDQPLGPIVSYASPRPPGAPVRPGTETPAGVGSFSLDFVDTDLRDVVAEILGNMLRVNYAIDPNVKGTVTLRTVRPLTREELLPTLQGVVSQNNAVLVQNGSFYRVTPLQPNASGQTVPGTGGIVVPLRYASAEDLARVLQPYVASGGKVLADPQRNALLIVVDADGREALLDMVKAFDVDVLVGQSYALLPVSTGGVADLANALQEVFRTKGGAMAGLVRVVPMERVNAVLVISPQRDYITAARRFYETLNIARRQSIRNWYVYYLQNGQANDVANLMQQAFTPGNVTAQPSRSGGSSAGRGPTGAFSGGMQGGGMAAGGGGMAAGTSGAASTGGGGAAGTPTTVVQQQPNAGSANPLLGGLDVLGTGGNAGAATTDGARIVSNETNNALMLYATPQEYGTMQAMLRRIDILPLQVRIDATIAEVTLNDTLKYGTQYFFQSGGLNSLLSYASTTLATPATAPLSTLLPGFFIGGNGQGGAPLAISALQGITEVNVLSSPQLLVLDNQQARLQVGSLVPYLSQTAQSTIAAGAPVINSVNYQQTGVLMQITPRVNSGGLVTLDIAQEVSEVDNTAAQTGTGINSPTFQNRVVNSRVVVQDGQTIGLAGLIRDSASRGNDGIPGRKDVPLLGFLAGRQSNQRVRTELIVMITPHVMHDQRDARLLSEDMRDKLLNAALVPQLLRDTTPSGSTDPQRRFRGSPSLPTP